MTRENPPVSPSAKGGEGLRSASIIRTEGLTKCFGDFIAVDHLSVCVAPGSIFAFLGANGSGKSTTMRMLIGLLQPTAGTIEVDGIDVIRQPRRVRDRIGYMGQKVSLYRGLSLRENVEFFAGLFGLAGGELEHRWGVLRERFSLHEAERERAEDLPAGVRQRAGLAVSTLHHPRLLFLDEPTAGVDVHHRGLFWDFIHDEASAGVTVFVTTHFLEEAEYCDWVAFIDAGRLIANAEPAALRRHYADGYHVQVEVPATERARAAAWLAQSGCAVESTGTGLHLVRPALEAPVFAALDRIRTECREARIQIEQASMTDVFRRVVAAAGGAT